SHRRPARSSGVDRYSTADVEILASKYCSLVGPRTRTGMTSFRISPRRTITHGVSIRKAATHGGAGASRISEARGRNRSRSCGLAGVISLLVDDGGRYTALSQSLEQSCVPFVQAAQLDLPPRGARAREEAYRVVPNRPRQAQI